MNCGKPPTNDEKCPRCHNDWDVKIPPRPALALVSAAIDLTEFHGSGVVRRNGAIVRGFVHPSLDELVAKWRARFGVSPISA